MGNLALRVDSVELRNFRNYREVLVDLDPGLNLVCGLNAQGKTNFLEALYLLGTTRLLRGQRDSEAILEGESQAHVTAELNEGRTQIGVALEGGVRKRATLNGAKLPRAADLIGRLPCVCISALDLAIVRDEPSDRRLFLDLELSALYPAYLRQFAIYKRAVEQRNALLKHAREAPISGDRFEVWEEQIASAGAFVREARTGYLAELSPVAEEAHARIGGGERLGFVYEPNDEARTSDDLLRALIDGRDREIARGSTSYGPHRDDFRIEVGSRDARLFGSQGQQRTSVMALKLATFEIGRRRHGAPPLLLLDDILSDLDEGRRRRLIDVVLGLEGQTVLTCTEAESAGPDVARRAKLFMVSGGRFDQVVP